MEPIIDLTELKSIIGNANVIVVDVRKSICDNPKRIKGSVFIDLNIELSKLTAHPSDGGRHPLPSVADFVKVLGQKGITVDSRVICYDDNFGSNAAARLWWMLRSIGHEKVQVLNGGISVIDDTDSILCNNSHTVRIEKLYEPIFSSWSWPLVSKNEVYQNISDKAFDLIDVREGYRYRGEAEPLDVKAGHIPGSKNIFFKNNLDSEGYFLSKDEIRKNFEGISSPATFHCGSGVTACHAILAMVYAGLPLPALYVGSWSEWSNNDLPVATEPF